MKNWLHAVGIGAALLLAVSAQAADKIAVVNVSSIFQQMPQREAVAQELEKEFQPRAAELQKMEQNLGAKQKKLQREAATMKPADRTKLEQELTTGHTEFNKKVDAFEKDNRNRQAEERNKLLSQIQTAVRSIAKSDGYTLVIDSSVIAYGDEAMDITNKVLAQVKAQQAK